MFCLSTNPLVQKTMCPSSHKPTDSNGAAPGHKLQMEVYPPIQMAVLVPPIPPPSPKPTNSNGDTPDHKTMDSNGGETGHKPTYLLHHTGVNPQIPMEVHSVITNMIPMEVQSVTPNDSNVS
jgi:hypothetical protein